VRAIAITGGSGLIGRHLAAALAAAGDEVRILSRRPERLRDLPAGVSAHGWDGTEVDALTGALGGCAAVVHLAGESIGGGRWSAERKRRILESRVDSSHAVAGALAASGMPRVMVQASAVGYYGPRGDEPLDESAAAGGDFLATVCRRWERASREVEELGVRRAVARSGVVLATDGGALPRMLLPFRLFAGGPLGDGRQWLPWIHLDDEVAALRFLIDEPRAAGAFNLTAPEPATNRAFAGTLGRVLRRPSLLPTPAFALRLALGEMATLLLDGQRAVPSRLLKLGFTFRFATAEAALRDLL